MTGSLRVRQGTSVTKKTKKETTMRTWKGMLVGLAVVIAATGWTTPAGASSCGDVTNDNKVNVGDAQLLLQAANNLPGTYCGGLGASQCGDMNNDGGVNVNDVVILLNFLAGKPLLTPICTGLGNPIPCSGPGGTGAVAGEIWTGSQTITGNITTNQIWPEKCRVNIDGLVKVQPGVTVTIKPGALVAGVDPPSDPVHNNTSALIFLRGSKINAAGTAAKPILMQSSDHLDSVGGGHVGDWGGLTINGNAPVNCPGGECLAEGLTGVPFGGNDPHDSSGVMRFVRLEFSGKELTPDNELNCITINGVGDGTTWDHTQTNVCFDDCHEWFGGTVNGDHLVSSGCGDDQFDTQLGTVGKFQWLLGVYYQPFLQNQGNEATEWDDNENGFDLLPRNAPHYCNYTSIGTALQTDPSEDVGLGGTEFATNFRRGTAGTIENYIMAHFRIRGLEFRDNSTSANACDAGPVLHTPTVARPALLIDHGLLFDNGFKGEPVAPVVAADGQQVHNNTGSSNTFTTPCTGTQYYGLLTNVSPTDFHDRNDGQTGSLSGHNQNVLGNLKYGTTAVGAQTDLTQFIPTAAPDASTPVSSLAGDCRLIDSPGDPTKSFFKQTDYLGAFNPNAADTTNHQWLSTPWISFELK